MEAANVENIVQDHERRLLKVEDEMKDVKDKLSSVENVNLQTQNIVLNQNKSMQENFDKLLTGVIDIKKTNVSGKYSMFSQLFTGALGAGGAIWAVIEVIKYIASK
jgi:hypothetical protein